MSYYRDREKGPGYVVAFLYSLVVAAFWIPALVLRRTGRLLKEVGVENWPRANGTVTVANVNVIHGWIVDYALGQLGYSYKVSGEYYAGSVTRQYPDEQAAWDFVDAHRNQPVFVRYRDSNPQMSSLLEVDQQPPWNNANAPSIPAMVWQHWLDELRSEAPAGARDEGSLPDGKDTTN